MLNKSRLVKIIDLGKCDYHNCWNYQYSLQRTLIDAKRGGRFPGAHYLLLCQHPPVYTLGKSGSEKNLLVDQEQLQKIGAKFVPINRGGDITFHGPGQLVIYPILDLDHFFTDIHLLIRKLETTIIDTLRDFGIKGMPISDFTGVWIDEKGGQDRKICALGIHLSRWVSMHGLALNVNTDLSYFDHIIPCGISDNSKKVTSMEAELGRKMEMAEVKRSYIGHFGRHFKCDFLVN